MGVTTGALGALATSQNSSAYAYSAGTTASALSSIIQGNTAQDLADGDAQTAREAAMEHAANLRKATRRTVGSARAATAGSGVALDAFSNIVTDDIQNRGAKDEATAVLDGERAAISAHLQGGLTKNASYATAGGELLKGAVYSGWKGIKNGDENGMRYSRTGADIRGRR